MLTLHFADYRVQITNEPALRKGPTDSLVRYDVSHRFSDGVHLPSRHALRLFRDNQLIPSCLFSAGGGVTGVHNHTAIMHSDNCIIAVGDVIASVAVPALNLNWVTRIDDATCFGVYESAAHNCLISHGELLISRLTHDGRIVWQTGGTNIFTNGFQIDGDVIRVVDFNECRYAIDIDTGREIMA